MLSCNGKVKGLIPGQGTYLGCGFDPWLGRVLEATSWCFSLAWMFPSLPVSLPLFKKNEKCPRLRLKKNVEEQKGVSGIDKLLDYWLVKCDEVVIMLNRKCEL